MNEANLNYWKRCSTCKKEIPFEARYYVCSVSTCQSGRTALRFCSVPCWDAHLGFARHRESTADETRAPTRASYEEELQSAVVHETANDSTAASSQQKKVIVNNTPVVSSQKNKAIYDVDTLVVVSKVKQFIRDHSEYNTSQCLIDALTKKIVDECLQAIDNARSAGRKTVMGRDVR